MKIQVSKDQIRDWADNPVTLAFKKIASKERDETLAGRGVNAYHPFQPERTQEILAGLNGSMDTWELVIAALEGEGLWELDDDDEARFE